MIKAFIPTKGRPEMARACADSLVKFGPAFPIVVIEEPQYAAYRPYFPSGNILLLDQEDMGLGYASAQIVENAYRVAGADHILIAHDDVRVGSEYTTMLEAVKFPSCVGIGGWASIYGLYLRDYAEPGDGIVNSPNGMGGQFMAINVSNVIAVGNFPVWADVGMEDHELFRQTIASGRRWWIDTDSKYGCAAKRFAPGGSATFEDREERQWETWRRAWENWPKYISDPWHSTKYRCQWKKMIEDYTP